MRPALRPILCLLSLLASVAPNMGWAGTPANGALVIGVSVNSPQVSHWAEIYQSLELGGPSFMSNLFNPLRSRTIVGQAGGTTLYHLELPPGTYPLRRLVNTWTNQYGEHSEWLDLEGMLPAITIEPGRLVDGGTLVVRLLGSDKAAVAHLPSAPGQLDYARAELGSKLSIDPSVPVLTWEVPGDTVSEQLEISRRVASPAGAFFADRAGRVLVPAKFGQLLHYEGDAGWSVHPTGLTSTLFTVYERREGGLVVGGEFGAIARSDGLSGAWTSEQLPPGTGAVLGLAETASGELVVLVAQGARFGGPSEILFSGYRPTDLVPVGHRIYKREQSGTWSLVREVPLKGFDLRAAFADGDVLVVPVANDRVGRWSAADGSWTEVKVPGDGPWRSPDGTWVSRDGTSAFYSRDRGTTWTELARGRMGKSEKQSTRVTLLGVPVPLATLGHWLVEAQRPFENKTKSSALYRSRDDGQNWYKVSTAEKICQPTHRLASIGEKSFAVCRFGEVYSSDAPTAEWKARKPAIAPAR